MDGFGVPVLRCLKVTTEVPVLMTSCQVSEKSNTGPIVNCRLRWGVPQASFGSRLFRKLVERDIAFA